MTWRGTQEQRRAEVTHAKGARLGWLRRRKSQEDVTCRNGLFTWSVWAEANGILAACRDSSPLNSPVSLSLLTSPGSCANPRACSPVPPATNTAWCQLGPWLRPLSSSCPAAAGLSEGPHSPLTPDLCSHTPTRTRAPSSPQLSQNAQPCCVSTSRASSWGGSLPPHGFGLSASTAGTGLAASWGCFCSGSFAASPDSAGSPQGPEPFRKLCFLPLSLPVLGTATTEA